MYMNCTHWMKAFYTPDSTTTVIFSHHLVFQIRMTDVKVLKSLAGTESSGVRLLKNHKLTLSLSQSCASSLEFGVTKVLASKLLEYEPR